MKRYIDANKAKIKYSSKDVDNIANLFNELIDNQQSRKGRSIMIAIILIMFGILGLGMVAIAIGVWTDNDIVLKIGIVTALFIVGTAFLSLILGGIALLKG